MFQRDKRFRKQEKKQAKPWSERPLPSVSDALPQPVPSLEAEPDADQHFGEFQGSVDIKGVRLSGPALQELKQVMDRFGYGSLSSIPTWLLQKAENKALNGKLVEDRHASDLEDAMDYTGEEQLEDRELELCGIEDEEDLRLAQEIACQQQAYNAAYHVGGTRPQITAMHIFGTVPIYPSLQGFAERTLGPRQGKQNMPMHDSLFSAGCAA